MNFSKHKLIFTALASTLFVFSSYAENASSLEPIDLLANSSKTISNTINKKTSPWSTTTTFKEDGTHKVMLRADFTVEDPSKYYSLAFNKSYTIKNVTINGEAIKVPIEGMNYKTIPGIPPILLKKGKNLLEISWETRVKSKKNKDTARIEFSPSQISASDINISLIVQKPEDIKFQTGPVLGYAGVNFFTVACRVNMPAEVTLKVNNKEYVSPPALSHSFKVGKLSRNTAYKYELTAKTTKNNLVSVGPYTVKTLPKRNAFKFAVLGDSRSHPKDWEKVAMATKKAKPAFAIFSGDMIANGLNDYDWDKQFFSPAKEFLATIPFYGIVGNHESEDPLFTKLFKLPQNSKNWFQQVGSVLFIGIDGAMDWSAGSEHTKWLEKILSKSKAKFIFLSSHYPPWTSSWHGRLNRQGRPAERTIRQGQDVIMPLLEKYNATAMFTGHDHAYERSEPPGGVSVIISGGAGAPLYSKSKNAAKQNPYSKVFVSTHHYCIISVKEDTCSIEAIDLNGKVIDSKTWTARK